MTRLPKIDPQFFQTFEETQNWLDEMEIKNYSIDPKTLIVDVDAHVFLINKNLKYLPVQFGKIEGCFNCSNNKLTSLKGSPRYVNGFFYCNNNQLVNLKYAPQYVKIHFFCHTNRLSSLDGLINCNIKEIFFYNYNSKLSPLFECKQYQNLDTIISIPFNTLKELLLVEHEQKRLESKITSYEGKTIKKEIIKIKL